MVRYAGTAPRDVVRPHPVGDRLADRVAEAGRVQAWVCGSGLGTDERGRATELRAVLAAPVPVVLDADALTLLVDGTLADGCASRDAPTVLTPHDRRVRPARRGGAGRGPGRPPRCELGRLDSASVVLLKGDRTIVADAGRRAPGSTRPARRALATGGHRRRAGRAARLAAGRRAARRRGRRSRRPTARPGRPAAARGGPVTAPDVAAASAGRRPGAERPQRGSTCRELTAVGWTAMWQAEVRVDLDAIRHNVA